MSALSEAAAAAGITDDQARALLRHLVRAPREVTLAFESERQRSTIVSKADCWAALSLWYVGMTALVGDANAGPSQ